MLYNINVLNSFVKRFKPFFNIFISSEQTDIDYNPIISKPEFFHGGICLDCFRKTIIIFWVIFFIMHAFSNVDLRSAAPLAEDVLAPCSEVWAYLMQGEENEMKGGEPVTDLCYFAGGLTISGNVKGARELNANSKISSGTRTHLVIASQNATLLHFVLDPELPLRKRLVNDIESFSTKYTGIQIDFEDINPEDRDNYSSFISDVKKAIGAKTLSVALPAKTSTVKGAYDFSAIGSIADRIIIMAYDEHWGGNGPGPVASIAWCEKVAAYAKATVPNDRLVMGIPFYGRSWQDKKNDRRISGRDVHEVFGEYVQELECLARAVDKL